MTTMRLPATNSTAQTILSTLGQSDDITNPVDQLTRCRTDRPASVRCRLISTAMIVIRYCSGTAEIAARSHQITNLFPSGFELELFQIDDVVRLPLTLTLRRPTLGANCEVRRACCGRRQLGETRGRRLSRVTFCSPLHELFFSMRRLLKGRFRARRCVLPSSPSSVQWGDVTLPKVGVPIGQRCRFVRLHYTVDDLVIL